MTSSNVVTNTKLVVWVLAWFVVTVVLMVGAAYLWVFLYSVFIDSSGDQAFYEAYAQRASPVVAVLTAFPVFFLMGRFMRRFDARAATGVVGVIALHILMEIGGLLTLTDTLMYVLMFSVVSLLLKIAGGYVGVRKSNSL